VISVNDYSNININNIDKVIAKRPKTQEDRLILRALQMKLSKKDVLKPPPN